MPTCVAEPSSQNFGRPKKPGQIFSHVIFVQKVFVFEINEKRFSNWRLLLYVHTKNNGFKSFINNASGFYLLASYQLTTAMAHGMK